MDRATQALTILALGCLLLAGMGYLAVKGDPSMPVIRVEQRVNAASR